MFKITCLLIILFLSTFAHGKEEIRFGVFAYLGYEKTKEKYEPLIEYLNTKLDKKVIGRVDIAKNARFKTIVVRQDALVTGLAKDEALNRGITIVKE